MEATLQNIAWRTIAEPISPEDVVEGDIIVWKVARKEKWFLDLYGWIYALKGDMGVVIKKQYSGAVVNFFKDAYQRNCFVNIEDVDFYKAEDYDFIDMSRYGKKGNPPKLSQQIQNTVEASSQSVKDFLEELTPDDVGSDIIGKYIVAYEGFTYECWEDAEENDKSVDDLEEEILKEWQREYKSKPIRYGWLRGGEFGEDDIFYAIFPNKRKLSWQERIDPGQVWDGITSIPDSFWEDLSTGLKIYRDAQKKYEKLPSSLKSFFNKMVSRWEKQHTKETLAWQERIDPAQVWSGKVFLTKRFWDYLANSENDPVYNEWAGNEWEFLPKEVRDAFTEDVMKWENEHFDKLSWKIPSIAVGDNVKITEDVQLLETIGIFPGIAGALGEVVAIDATYNFRDNIADVNSYDGVVDVSINGHVWGFPYSHWQDFLTIEHDIKLSWQQHLDPKSIWDGSKQMLDMFWEHIPDKIRFYGDGLLSYDKLPEDIQEGFNEAVKKWEKFWSKRNKKKLSWKAIFEPDKDVATVMYALAGADYPFVISLLLGLADTTLRAILGALTLGGYEEVSQELDKFVEDCNSIVDGAFVYYNTDNIDTDKVKEYATTLPNFSEMEALWEKKLCPILRELSETVVNRKTSAVGAHVAWYFQPVPEVSPSTKAIIKEFMGKMSPSTDDITIVPFVSHGFVSPNTLLANLKAALQNDGAVDLYNDVVWQVKQSDSIFKRAFDKLRDEGIDSVEASALLSESEITEYEQKYIKLYNTFQQIVGGENA